MYFLFVLINLLQMFVSSHVYTILIKKIKPATMAQSAQIAISANQH